MNNSLEQDNSIYVCMVHHVTDTSKFGDLETEYVQAVTYVCRCRTVQSTYVSCALQIYNQSNELYNCVSYVRALTESLV